MGTDHGVATSVTRLDLQAVEELGWPVRPDWSAHGLDLGRLTAASGWIRWDEYLRFLVALGGPKATAETWERLGALFMAYGGRAPFRHLARLVDVSGPLFEVTYGHVLPSVLLVVRPVVATVGRGHLRVTLEVPQDEPPSEVFFHLTTGTLRRLPGVVGASDARVDASVGPRAATYEVFLPPRRGLVARAARALRVLGGTNQDTASLVAEVDRTVAALREARAREADAEAHWRALARGMPGVAAILEGDGTVVEVFGRSPPPAGLRVGASWVEGFVPEDRAALAELVRTCRSADGAAIEVRSAEPAAWWTCHVGPVADRAERLVAVALDTTDRHRAEAALRETERRFQHAQKMEAIGRLSGGLAHDINNVLTAVQAHADLLAVRLRGVVDAAPQLDGITDAVARASALTRRLLASGRTGPATGGTTDLRAFVVDARALLRRVVGEHLRLDLEVPDEPVPVGLDLGSLEQVLLNLVVNARDALVDGGRLAIRVRRQGSAAELVVEDEGHGMTEEVLRRAVEPFFTTKAVGLGSGLGLTAVRDLVEGAGGTLSIDSQPGRGTAVTARLPLVVLEAGPPVGRPAPLVLRSAGQRVLLVEDQDDVREMMVQMLDVLGYRARACANGEVALRVFEAEPASFDALVTDVVMPGIGGHQLALALRARRPDLPTLFVSGFSAEASAALDGDGPSSFLAKPFSLRDLSTAMGALLDGRGPRLGAPPRPSGLVVTRP